jgi:hypothetical protein
MTEFYKALFRANRARKALQQAANTLRLQPGTSHPHTGRPSAPMADDLELNYASVEFWSRLRGKALCHAWEAKRYHRPVRLRGRITCAKKTGLNP